MARPTKAEQERKRIAALQAEGKGPDGQPISEATIISETKNPVVTPAPSNDKSGGISISELENEIENSTLGKGAGTTTNNNQQKQEGGNIFDMGSGNVEPHFNPEDDPDYVKPSGHDRFRETLIQNESDANTAATSNSSAGTANPMNPTPPPPPPPKDFEEPIINGSSPPDPGAADGKKKEEPLINPDLDDLSPTERRKQVEMFADAILTTYAELYHAAFSGYCSVKMNKMEILDRDGKIRLSMTIQRDEESGEMTVREVFRAYNEEVDQVFTVTEEMKNDLREPLIAVLMEKGIAPTPMVSLLIHLGRHLLMGVFSASALKSKIGEQIETFTKFRKEELEMELTKHKTQQHGGGNNGNNNGSAGGPSVVVPPVNPVSPSGDGKIVSMEEAMNKVEVKPVEIKSESRDLSVSPPATSNSGDVTIEEYVNNEK